VQTLYLDFNHETEHENLESKSRLPAPEGWNRSLLCASAFDSTGLFIVAKALEAYLDESEQETVVVIAGAFGSRDQWRTVRNYCAEGRRKFGIPYFRMVEVRHLSEPYRGWTEEQKKDCIDYFVRCPRGITPIAYSIVRSEFEQVFDTNAKRGIVGNVFGVCALALIGAMESYAQRNRISRVDYFFEAGGPAQATIDRVAAEAGLTVSHVQKHTEPVTDIADAIAYEYCHLVSDERGNRQRPRNPLDKLIEGTQYKFVDIQKGALYELLEASGHWRKSKTK
jgi:hypothetical protein